MHARTPKSRSSFPAFLLLLAGAYTFWNVSFQQTSTPQAFNVKDEADKLALKLFDKDHDGVIEKEELMGVAKDGLSHLEGVVEAIKKLPKLPKHALETAGGVMMLFYSQHIATSVLFFQAFRVTGWPTLQRGIDELKLSYARAREEATKQMPTFLKTKEMLPQLLEEKKEAEQTFRELRSFARTALKDKKDAESHLVKAKAVVDRLKLQQARGDSVDMSVLKEAEEEASAAFKQLTSLSNEAGRADELRLKAEANMAAIRGSYNQAIASTRALKSIADAVNPEHLQECAKGIGTGVVSCIAAAKAPLARAACQGADVGDMLSRKVTPFVNNTIRKFNSVPESFADWGTCMTSTACTAGMAYAAFQLQEVSLTIAACALGAKTVTQAAERQIRQFKPDLHLGDIVVPKANMTATAAMETALTAVGVYSQVGPGRGGASLPGVFRTLFAPVLALEAYLRGSVMATSAKDLAAKKR